MRQSPPEPAGGITPEGPGWSVWQNRVDDLLQALFPAGDPGAVTTAP